MRPPAPVHLRTELAASGDLRISWVRRSRSGWHWADGSDTPLGEEREAYRLTLSAAGFERSIACAEAAYTYPAALREEDALTGPLTVTVVQLGTSAASRPARLTIMLG
jgi:hypothetical protein